jgi:MoxR-like ATPase
VSSASSRPEVTRPFRPSRIERQALPEGHQTAVSPDRRDGAIYVYHDEDIKLAVNAALVTGRPLLVNGSSGCGKSSLALNIALNLRRRYYEYVVVSSSEAEQLIYKFDAVRRLNDATAGEIKKTQSYIEPGPLWWALDPNSARHRGPVDELSSSELAHDPSPAAGDDAVVLVDEIDKAEPDFPNNLLVPLGSLVFSVAPTGFVISGSRSPLVIITNNGERELPVPFVRRCIALTLPDLTEEKLVEIARAHFRLDEHDENLFRTVAKHVTNLAKDDTIEGANRRLSAAEYLDTIRACRELGIRVDDEEFKSLSLITLRKAPSKLIDQL